jgi:serine/threonine protein kinase
MGERFGKYELLQRIAVGGMAEVYVARTYGAEGFVKELVIKRILPQYNEDPDFVTMFINEARLAAKLQHANIVQIYDFNHVDDVYYIAMEYVDGSDLRKIQGVAKRRKIAIPASLAVHVGVEALKGLHYAHTRSDRGRPLELVHRDISPHNLLFSFSGELKVADFGIAKVAALASATRTGMVKGKLTYMAPEQVRGDPIDARCDLYSLGIILWELLSGQRLYGDVGSEGELVVAARRGVVTPLAEVAPDVDPQLASVVSRLLEPSPDDRYGSAAEALADLSRFHGATHAIEVSEFLQQLLPASAEAGRRGETEIQQVVSPEVKSAPADAATHTRQPELADSEQQSEDDPAQARRQSPSIAQEQGSALTHQSEAGPESWQLGSASPQHLDTPVAVDRESGLDGPGSISGATPMAAELASMARPRLSGVFWATCLVLLFSAAGLSWWLSSTQSSTQARSSRSDATPRLAKLELFGPEGTRFEIDGVPVLGKPPYRLHGAKGTKLQLVAKLGEQVLQRQLQLGDEKVLRLSAASFSSRAAKPAVSAKVQPGADKKTASAANSSSANKAPHTGDLARPKPGLPADLSKRASKSSKSSKDAVRQDAKAAAARRKKRREKKRATAQKKALAAKAAAAAREALLAAAKKRSQDASKKRHLSSVKTKKTSKPAGFGSLTVTVDPWAKVYLDGRHIGITAIRNYRVRVGRHRLELRNGELRKSERITIVIRKDKRHMVRRRW